MRIDDNLLLKLSFLFAAVGIVALAISTTRPMTFAEVTDANDGTHVKLSGTVTDVRSLGDNHTLLEISSACTINSVVFGKSQDTLSGLEGRAVVVSGTKEEYEGSTEILVERIEELI